MEVFRELSQTNASALKKSLTELSGEEPEANDCMPAPFVCFRLLDSVLAPRMRYYRPRVRLMGRLLRFFLVTNF